MKDETTLVQKSQGKIKNLLLEANKTLDISREKKLLGRRFKFITSEFLVKPKNLLIAYTIIITYYNKLKWTHISYILGNAILIEFLKWNIKKYKKSDKKLDKKSILDNIDYKNLSFEKFKEKLEIKNESVILLGDYFIELLSIFPHNIFERSYDFKSPSTKDGAIIKINNDLIEDIKKNIIIHPKSLPTVCKPNRWATNLYGGFLENKKCKEKIISTKFNNKHKTKNLKVIYQSANILNQIEFGINNILLDYLMTDGKYLLANHLQEQITLKLSNMYRNIPIYLTVKADWRGRLYT